MGLFLSKLLPLFFYPIGFACGSMLLALVLLWKRPRWAAGVLLLGLLVLWLSSTGLVAGAITRSLESRYLPPPVLPTADAIVVLGGSVRQGSPPRPLPDVTEAGDRIVYGAKLYRDGKAPVLILSGGRIAWQGDGVPESPESADMAQLAGLMGVPRSAIIEDPTSLTTYENAVNVKRILEINNLRRILLVTSASHMPRAMAIFQRLGMDAIAAPTDFLVINTPNPQQETRVEATLLKILPDAESLRYTTRAIKEYVGLFVYWLRGWV